MPKIYAHRGGSGYFVENTLKAFEFAIELGCAGAELDVRLTQDGEIIVHHNDKLNHKFARKADGNWITPEEEALFKQLTLEKVQQYTVGEPNPKTHNHKTWPNLLPEPNQPIPTLGQVIDLAQKKSDSFELIIEIKTDIFDTNQTWLPLVDKVLDLVKQKDFTQRVKFCSFNWNTLLYIQQQAPDIPLWFTTHPLSWLAEGEVPKTDVPPRPETLQYIRQAWLTGNAPWYAGHQPKSFEDFPKVIKQLGGEAWFCYHTDATPANLIATHDQPLQLATWSVNLKDADALEKLNLVDALCVDYPNYRFVKPSAELKNFLAIADQARKDKKWQQAEHYYQLILDAYPEQSPVGVYKGLAICQRMQKKFDRSLEVLNQSLVLFINRRDLLLEKAKVFYEQGEFLAAYNLLLASDFNQNKNVNFYYKTDFPSKFIDHYYKSLEFDLNDIFFNWNIERHRPEPYDFVPFFYLIDHFLSDSLSNFLKSLLVYFRFNDNDLMTTPHSALKVIVETSFPFDKDLSKDFLAIPPGGLKLLINVLSKYGYTSECLKVRVVLKKYYLDNLGKFQTPGSTYSFNRMMLRAAFEENDVSLAKRISSMIAKESKRMLIPSIFQQSPFREACSDELIRKTSYNKNDHPFSDYMKGKSVAIVGPVNVGLNNGDEIDRYDIVIRMNVRKSFYQSEKKIFGSKANVSYNIWQDFKRYGESEYKEIEDLDFIVVCKWTKDKAPWAYDLPCRRSVIERYEISDFLLNPMLIGAANGVQRIVADVLRFRPSVVKIFNSDLFLSMNYQDGYVRKKSPIGSFVYHEPVSNFIYLKNLYLNQEILADSVLSEILKLPAQDYSEKLEYLYCKKTKRLSI